MPVINTHQNIAAFLDMLAVSEGTANHPLTKNRGYDVIVTGLDGKPEIFTDYSDHPFAHGRPAKVFNRRGEKSTASGRYQQLYLFWPHYRKQLALPDFSPLSQDRLAIQLIRERGALDDIRAGRIERAISRCRNIWASLPGAGYRWRRTGLNGVNTMKKLSLSQMLNVSLALMLALSLIYPQSVAVSFVATWAILATVICVVAGGVGVYATEYVLERYGRELPPESLAVKIVTSLFLQPVPWRRRAVALVVMVATFISLVAAGWIFTALIYLLASVFFRLIRTACRQRFEGREPCQG